MNEHVIGIESTAHTFSASVVSSDGQILSNVSNIYKAPEGSGIHPFEASKSHMAAAARVVGQSLDNTSVEADDLSAVCYSMGPGLGPCLRVGAVVARTLASSLSKPLVPVNHAVGHIELGCLLTKSVDPLVLLVSGGHTMVIGFSAGRWRVLGETLDLTLGQLLDQFGRNAGLPSPCGRMIEQAALNSSNLVELPYTVKGNDVSFSGLLTSAKKLHDGGATFSDVCFSLQETAFAMMVEVVERALAFTEKDEVMVVGGVAANKRLSEMLGIMADRHSAKLKAVPLAYSGDCGAQIAWTGYLAHKAGVEVSITDSDVLQSWRLDSVDIPWRN
jgi:N6-L-threonylcarbamoyladenine synthase